jgi:hypothetical protein
LESDLKAFQRDLATGLVDGLEVCHVLYTTLIPAVVRARACRKGLFAGRTAFGRSVSRTERVSGFKVARSVSARSVMSAFGLAPANCDQRPTGDFLLGEDGHGGFLADEGFSSVAWEKH